GGGGRGWGGSPGGACSTRAPGRRGGRGGVPRDTKEERGARALLGGWVLEGKVVTADAMFCHKEVCEQIVGQGGDYVLIVKDNQPSLKEAIATLLPDAPPSRPSRRTR